MVARARVRRLAAVLAATVALTGLGVVADGPAGPVAVVADERSNLEQQRDAQRAARDDLGSQLDGVSSDLGNTYLALADARARLPVAEAELAAAELRVTQITERLGLAEAEHASLGAEIAQGAQSIDATRSSIGSLARSTYRGDGLPNALALVTGASSSEQFLDQAMATSAAARSQQDSLALLEMDVALNRNKEARQAAVAERVAELKAEADAARDSAQASRDEIAKLEEDMAARAAELESRRGEIESQIAESDAAVAALAQRIAEIDEANRRAQLVFVSGAGSGRFQAPTNACVNSEWGLRMHPILGYPKLHEGIDQRAGTGVPQAAMADGVVVSVHNDVGGGLMVVINHGLIDGNSVVTKHLHLSSASVSAGQRVSKGQQVGLTGATGRVTGAHVHHEVWVNGSSVNPRSFYGDQVASC